LTESKEETESLEEEVFKALDHQKRRDILRFVGERRGVTFTEMLNATKTQRDSQYSLTSIGKAAYGLLLKTADYRSFALLHRRKTGAIIGHVFLWICAIAAALVLETDWFYSSIILPTLAGSSLMTIYGLFE